jgi:hypothetical protein
MSSILPSTTRGRFSRHIKQLIPRLAYLSSYYSIQSRKSNKENSAEESP